MLARVQSYLLQGIDALPCEVEVDFDIADMGGEKQMIVGLPDAAVKESLERVRSALANSGYFFPRGKTLINLAPADVRKEGPLYDLPMAVGMLITQGVVSADASPRPGAKGRTPPGAAARSGIEAGTLAKAPPAALDPRQFLFAGELALDGRLRPIKGAIAMAALAQSRGARGVVVPAENAAEAAVVPGVEVLGVRTITEVVGLLRGEIEARPEPPADIAGMLRAAQAPIDFSEVRGQEAVKRAIIVAAAGSHNILKLGPTASRGGGVPRRGLGHNLFEFGPSYRHGGGRRRQHVNHRLFEFGPSYRDGGGTRRQHVNHRLFKVWASHRHSASPRRDATAQDEPAQGESSAQGRIVEAITSCLQFAICVLVVALTTLGCAKPASNAARPRQMGEVSQPSRSASTTLPIGQKLKYRKRLAVIVAIDKYPSTANVSPLGYACNDARDLRAILESEFGFAPADTCYLVDENATTENVEAAVSTWLKERDAREDDCLLFFFAGHGFATGSDRSNYLVLAKSDRDRPDTCMSVAWLKGKLGESKIRHKAMILACCHSGNLFKPDVATQPAPTEQRQAVGSIRGDDGVPVGDSLAYYLAQPAFLGLSAGRDTPVSDGSPGVDQHSIFVRELLQVMKERANSPRPDHVFTFRKLAADIEDRVATVMQRAQIPNSGRLADGDGDFLFFPPLPDIRKTPREANEVEKAKAEGRRLAAASRDTAIEDSELRALLALKSAELDRVHDGVAFNEALGALRDAARSAGRGFRSTLPEAPQYVRCIAAAITAPTAFAAGGHVDDLLKGDYAIRAWELVS